MHCFRAVLSKLDVCSIELSLLSWCLPYYAAEFNEFSCRIGSPWFKQTFLVKVYWIPNSFITAAEIVQIKRLMGLFKNFLLVKTHESLYLKTFWRKSVLKQSSLPWQFSKNLKITFLDVFFINRIGFYLPNYISWS